VIMDKGRDCRKELDLQNWNDVTVLEHSEIKTEETDLLNKLLEGKKKEV